MTFWKRPTIVKHPHHVTSTIGCIKIGKISTFSDPVTVDVWSAATPSGLSRLSISPSSAMMHPWTRDPAEMCSLDVDEEDEELGVRTTEQLLTADSLTWRDRKPSHDGIPRQLHANSFKPRTSTNRFIANSAAWSRMCFCCTFFGGAFYADDD